MREEFFDELLGRSGGEFFVKVDYEEMFDAQVANQSNFVLRGSEQMRRIVRAQHFDRMRIESDNERGSIRQTGMTRGSRNDGLMTKMDAVENSNCQEKWPAQALQFYN